MTRLALLSAAFITLHTPSGREVFVNADEIMMIKSPIPKNVYDGCLSEVTVHDQVACVREPPFVVKQLVEGAKQ